MPAPRSSPVSGAPAATAARAPRAPAPRARARPPTQASNSGFTCGGPKGPSATFTGMRAVGRLDLVRCGAGARARETSVAAHAEARSSRGASRARRRRRARRRASAEIVSAGRPFFIVIGVAHASSAPAARSASIQLAASSPVASSTFASRTAWVARSPARVRAVAGRAEHGAEEVRPIRAGRPCRRPSRRARAPSTATAASRAACAPTMAAPVGVTNSKSIPASYVASPARHSTVAGAGSGSDAVRAFTKPRPIGSGDTHHLGPELLERRGAPDDVGDGVDRADLVEVHVVDRRSGAPWPRPRRAAGRSAARAP